MGFVVSTPVYLLMTFPIVAFENSSHYVEVAAVTVAAVLVLDCVMVIPGRRWVRLSSSGQQATRSID
jgi:hypothetical protein